MKNDYLQSIIAKNKDNAQLAKDGLISDVTKFVDTGCYALNALVSADIRKGIPGNKIIGLSGDPATGKTFFALSIAKNFLNENPDNIVLYFESEGAITSDMLIGQGIDVERFVLFSVATIEEFRNQSIAILKDYNNQSIATRPKMMMVLDSLGMLSTKKETEDVDEGKSVKDMTKAGLIRGLFRVISLELQKADIPFIVTAHSYDQIGAMYPQKIVGGGLGLTYAASTILMLSKRKERKNDEIVGNIIRVKLQKGRFAIENKEVELFLDYQEGLHPYYGLIPVAEKHGVIKKISNKYELPDGTKVFESVLYKNPEKYFTPAVLDAINTACKKEFTYSRENSSPGKPVNVNEESSSDNEIENTEQ